MSDGYILHCDSYWLGRRYYRVSSHIFYGAHDFSRAFAGDSKIKKDGYSLVLKIEDDKIHTRYTIKDGVHTNKNITFDFKNLRPETQYFIELNDNMGKVLEKIVSDKKLGAWNLDK